MNTPSNPPGPGFDPQMTLAEPLAIELAGKPDEAMPIAEDWLTDAQLAQVRARLHAERVARGPVELTLHEDIFTRFGL